MQMAAEAATPLRIVLLPGLHGSDELAAPLLAQIPASFQARVVMYPKSRPYSYESLLKVLQDQIPQDEPALLIAESFSGPMAIRYAAARPDHVRGIVLSASFILPPAPRWIRSLPLKLILS